ncbi:MAG: SAM-dependent methyltransferase [Reichenbachiella sp.]
MKKGNIYLIPTIIADDTEAKIIAPQVREVIANIDYYLVENVRTARRYISKLKLGLIIEDLEFEVLDKKTNRESIIKFLQPVLEGRSAGIISESGCPGVADPGSLAVEQAHKFGIRVVPLSGPSSILMALMASGFNGQSFVFHGYVPIDKKDLRIKINEMELASQKLNQTQLFMDTPYRNQKLFEFILQFAGGETKLSIARGISGKDEIIQTKSINDWKKSKIELNKIPTIFSLFTGLHD